MVNIDLSKVLPSRAYEHLTGFLAAFLPGLFFVCSVVLARPDLVLGLAAKSEQTLVLGRYATAAMGLFLAFVIGSGFILVDSLIQYFLTYAYQVKILLYLQLCKWPLKQITQWLLTKPRWQSASLGRLHVLVVNRAAMGFEEWRKDQGCWSVLARRLLVVRYGIESKEFKDDEWEALYANLGSMTQEEFRGSIMMIALHASGWAGLVAARIAPVLQNKYYLGFCLFLILNGLLHAYYVIKRRYDPRISGGLAVRAILREFSKLGTTETPPTRSTDST